MSELDNRFPVLLAFRDKYPPCPKFVKWDELDENQAFTNYGQTLKRLTERGGLDPVEIYWNIKKLNYGDNVDINKAIDLVKSISID